MFAVTFILVPALGATATASPAIIEYTPSGSDTPVTGITSGPDGAVWFTEQNENDILRVSTSGSFTRYHNIGNNLGLNAFPTSITSGPDGALWFTGPNSPNLIGRITTSGSVTEYSLPTSGSQPYGITSGSDGNLWFTENNANQIGSITTSGDITEYSLPTSGSLPWYITSGPDGALWFSEPGINKIGSITTDGTITQYSTSLPPYAITSGPDGALWFTETNSTPTAKIGRITTSGSLTEYSLPTGSYPIAGITSGPDSALWFTTGSHNKIDRITTSGVLTEYSPLSSSSTPSYLTTGSDGNVWFAESGPKIGKLIPESALAVPTNLTAPTPTNQSPALSWTAASGATSYKVYRNGTNIDNASTTSYTDDSAPQGTNTYYVTAAYSGGGESSPSNTVSVAFDSTLPAINYFSVNDGSSFSRKTTPPTSGVSTQTINSDGSVTVAVNSAPGYADSGFTLYSGTLGDLPNFTVSGTGSYGLNLWFDSNNDNSIFQWDSNGVLTSLNGDTYGLGPSSSSGTLAISGSSQFYMMSNGQTYSLSDLKNGSVSGISSSTKVTIWIGVNVGSGSTSATISSISGL